MSPLQIKINPKGKKIENKGTKSAKQENGKKKTNKKKRNIERKNE